jgi:hypothetical protein
MSWLCNYFWETLYRDKAQVSLTRELHQNKACGLPSKATAHHLREKAYGTGAESVPQMNKETIPSTFSFFALELTVNVYRYAPEADVERMYYYR